MTKKFLLLLLIPIFIASASAVAQDLTITEMEICKKLDRMTPVESANSFEKSVGLLFCYTKITGPQKENTIYHVWYLNDKQKAKIGLKVRASSWRTYSKKTIPAEWVGEWRVDVTTVDGKVLKSKNFTIE